VIAPGSRVAWNHDFFRYPPEGVVYAESIGASHPPHHEDADAPAKFGEVVAWTNETGSLLEVQLDGEKHTRVLTVDELVRVKES
jgi:hypothetical protein